MAVLLWQSDFILHIAFVMQKSCEGTKTTKKSMVSAGGLVLLLKMGEEG